MKHVRVEVEIDEKAAHYGVSGTCTAVDEEAETVTFLSDFVSKTVPASAVLPRTQRFVETSPFFSFSSCSQIKKICMMHEVSGWDHEVTTPLVPISAGKPAHLEDEQLRLWFTALKASWPKASFVWFEPSVFLRKLFGDDQQAQEAAQASIQEAHQKRELLLFPIHCEEMQEHPMGHWTLLAIQKDSATSEQAQVRYYESMNDVNEICLSKALRILSILGLPQEGFDRCNQFRQKGAECTEVVMHYAELEVRHLIGEGWGSVPALHPQHKQKIRQVLSRFQSNLEPVRKKWVEDTMAEEMKKKYLELCVEQKGRQRITLRSSAF